MQILCATSLYKNVSNQLTLETNSHLWNACPLFLWAVMQSCRAREWAPYSNNHTGLDRCKTTTFWAMAQGNTGLSNAVTVTATAFMLILGSHSGFLIVSATLLTCVTKSTWGRKDLFSSQLQGPFLHAGEVMSLRHPVKLHPWSEGGETWRLALTSLSLLLFSPLTPTGGAPHNSVDLSDSVSPI